jgi:acyl-coenzyme A thioesterase PaaI-like protein
VTLDLGLSFLRSSTKGDLVTLRPEVTRQTKQIIFVRGDLKVGDETIATATSVWKVVKG